MKILFGLTYLFVATLCEDVRLDDLDPSVAQQYIESKDQTLKYAPKIETNVPAVRFIGNEPRNVLEDIYLANQYHGQDGLGGYLYGYSVPDIAKSEKKKAGGDLRGAYNYINGDGQEIKVEYWDDGTGFHQVDNVPKILPQQIDDTPEVKAAKEEHARLWAEQAERNSKPVEYPYENNHYKPEIAAQIGSHHTPGLPQFQQQGQSQFQQNKGQQSTGQYQGSYQQNPGQQHNPGQYQQNPGQQYNPGQYQQNLDQQHNPGQYQQNPGQQHNPGQYQQNSGQQHNPGQYQQNPGQYQQNPGQYQQKQGQNQQNPGQYQQNPGQYQQNPGQYQQNPGQYQQHQGQQRLRPGQHQQSSGQQQQQQAQHHQDQGQYQQPQQSHFQTSYQKPGANVGLAQGNLNSVDYTGQYTEPEGAYARPPSQNLKGDEEEEPQGPPRGFFYNFDYPVGIIVSKEGGSTQHKRESLSELYAKNKEYLEKQLKDGSKLTGSAYPNYFVMS